MKSLTDFSKKLTHLLLKKDILNVFLLVIIFLYPTAGTFGYSLLGEEGMFVSFVNILLVVFCIFFFINILMDRGKQYCGFYWIFGATGVVAIFLASILFSPFQPIYLIKGLIQVGGIFVVLMVGLGIINSVSKNTDFLFSIILTIKSAIFILAVVGIMQFFYFNFVSTEGLFNFSFLNVISHASLWNLSSINGVIRANSYAREPSFFSAFLNLGSGFVLIRLGVLGKEAKEVIGKYFSLSWALIVLVAFATTLSVLAVFMLICSYLALMTFMGMKKKIKIVALVVFVFLIVAIGIQFPSISLLKGEFVRKLSGIPMIFSLSLGRNLPGGVGWQDLSSLVLGVNGFVMLQTIKSYVFGAGVGGFLSTYLQFYPPYVHTVYGLYLLCSKDGGSLLIRILAETGIIGAVFYLSWIGWLFFRGWRILKRKYLDCGVNTKLSEYVVLYKGIYASSLSLFLYYLVRMGAYYDFEYWLGLALVASIPCVINKLLRFNKDERK